MKGILERARAQSAGDEPVKKEEEEDEEGEEKEPKLEQLVGVGPGGFLSNNFWAGNYEEDFVLSYEPESKDINNLFALGHPKFDDQFK